MPLLYIVCNLSFLSETSIVVFLDQSGLVDEERENAPSVFPISPLHFDLGLLLRLFPLLSHGPVLFILRKIFGSTFM